MVQPASIYKISVYSRVSFQMTSHVHKATSRLTYVKRKLNFSSNNVCKVAVTESCPDVVQSSRHFPKKVRSVEENCVQPTMGFLGLMSDDHKQRFDSKIEQKSKIRNSQRIEKPQVVHNLAALKCTFPKISILMLESMVFRFDGNCSEVFDYLVDLGWEPLIRNKMFYIDKTDDHYCTKYYHGLKPNEEQITTMFARRDAGAFITFFVYEDSDEKLNSEKKFNYCLLYKNMEGDLVEKPIKVPKVPEVVKALFGLSNGIRCKRQTAQNILPCI